MANSTGLQFTVNVGALPESTFAVASFKLDEGLNRPFNLHLEVASHQPDIDFGDVLDQPCELLVWYQGALQRRVCGVVSEFAQGDSGFRRTRYQLLVQPALWRLSLRHNSRIFQALKPDEILSILLQEHGIIDYAFALKNDHAKREYCVQYRETDLDFLNRLATEEGMFYFHEFEADKHRIVFADDSAVLTQGPELFFNLGNRSLEQGPYVRQFHYRESVRPSDVELKDYSFKTPAYGLSHKKAGAELGHQRDTYPHFDYPGRFKQDPSGKAFAQHRLDALRNDAMMSTGQSNCAALLPGQTFTLTEHRNAALNIVWQIVSITHTGTQPQALEEEGGDGPTTISNDFSVVKAQQTWRPRLENKPMVDGPQIANVVGPEGEEIYCDEHGRVKLQFPWDRYSEGHDQSSCWVRVSQGWAGGQYGMMAIPRIGHEVIVSFLEGDPDQPIVTGRTFHATNRPPYELPANKTRTVLRTETHQGEGFNELRFEDQAGQEEIYIHGQKDLNVIMQNDAAWHIKHDERRNIDNQRVTRIKANDHLTVQGEKRDHIKGDYSLTVDASLHQKIAQALLVDAGQEVHIKAGNKIVLEAGSELTLKVGGSFVKVDASGVTLVGPTIKMNSGGSPGNGSGWAGQMPGLPGVVKVPLAPPATIAAHAIQKSMESIAPLVKLCSFTKGGHKGDHTAIQQTPTKSTPETVQESGDPDEKDASILATDVSNIKISQKRFVYSPFVNNTDVLLYDSLAKFIDGKHFPEIVFVNTLQRDNFFKQLTNEKSLIIDMISLKPKNKGENYSLVDATEKYEEYCLFHKKTEHYSFGKEPQPVIYVVGHGGAGDEILYPTPVQNTKKGKYSFEIVDNLVKKLGLPDDAIIKLDFCWSGAGQSPEGVTKEEIIKAFHDDNMETITGSVDDSFSGMFIQDLKKAMPHFCGEIHSYLGVVHSGRGHGTIGKKPSDNAHYIVSLAEEDSDEEIKFRKSDMRIKHIMEKS